MKCNRYQIKAFKGHISRIKTIFYRWLIPACLILPTSCTLGPDYKLPSFDFSDFYQTQAENDAPLSFPTNEIQQDWWRQFNDETLNQLIDDALEHNQNIKQAIANVEEAAASRNDAQRDLFPDLTVGADATKSKSSGRTSSNNSSSSGTETDRITADGTLSWEVDLFGKLRRSLEAEDARIEAQQAAKHGVTLSVIAELVQNYVEVRGLQKRIHVTERNVELLKEVEKLAAIQLRNGAGTKLEVSQARGERQSFESRLPNLYAEMKAGMYRISVLAGKTPEHYLTLLNTAKPMPATPDVIPVGLRADILKNRPDIAIAERELAAANAEIGAAIADRYPDLSLTGTLGRSASTFSDLFLSNAGIFSLGANIAGELFDGGYEVDEAEAVTRAALANYRQTVLVALEEVESALIRYGSEWQTLKALKDAEKTRQEGFRIAKLRYREGEEEFLTILDAERSLVSAEDAVIQSEIDLLTKLITLYKALGGGWKVE